jgi:radical SAM-linked protein
MWRVVRALVGSPPVEQDPKTRIGLHVYQDHRGVVGTAGPVADRQRSLAELLDREILPCLERPGRLLGPFDLPSATVDGSTRLAIVWPSIAEGAHVPAALRPLLVGLPEPRHFALNLGSVPSPNLRAALREHGQPAFGRPDWCPLSDEHLWLVCLDHPLQLTGLLTLLDASRIGLRALERESGPRIVMVGPACEAVVGLCRVYADAVLPGLRDFGPRTWEILEQAAAAGPDASAQLATLGTVYGPVGAPATEPDDPGAVPAVREGHPGGGPSVRPDLCVPPAFLHREDWQEAGRAAAYVDHVVVGAASSSLRERHGLRPTDELVAAIEHSLSQEAASLCLHFVVGLEGETEADRIAVAEFVNQVVAVAPRGVRQVSATLHDLVEPADSLPTVEDFTGELVGRIERIRQRIRPRRVRLNLPAPGLALVERILGDGPEQAAVLEAAWAAGADHSESEACLDPGIWQRSLARARGLEPPAPDSSTSSETEPAHTGLPTAMRVVAPLSVSPDAPRTRAPRGRRVRPDRWTRWRAMAPQRFDYRIEYAKQGRLRFLGPAELGELLLGACERAQIPVCTTGVVQPRPRIGYGPALGAGITGDHEVLDLSLERKVPDLTSRLESVLPEGIRLLAVEFMPRCSPSMQLSRIAYADYEAAIDASVHRDSADRDADRARVRHWNSRIGEGLPPAGEDPADPIRQLCAIHWEESPGNEARIGFRLDLRAEGARCKPREVLARVLTGSSVDPRLIPLRRLGLLVVDDSSGRARLRTPLEQVLLARCRQRASERAWAE